MQQHGFHFNACRCTGCKTCMLACKDAHDLDSNTAFRQVYEMDGGTWTEGRDGLYRYEGITYYVSSACCHCANPACVEVCPTCAMHKGEFGLVSVDVHRCIGCGYCALSCPYHAPKVNRSAGHSVKCDGCAARVAAGLRPICVEACPLRALDFGPMDEIHARYGTKADMPPLPPSTETSPHLAVTLPACLEHQPSLTPKQAAVANMREIV